jgi:uncharacterized damage-inducible protein DinB
MNAGLVEFYKHNLWANLRLLEACAQLSDAQLGTSAPGTYGSISHTLVHLFRAEENYLALLQGRRRDSTLILGEYPGIDALCEHARRSGEGLMALAATVDLAQVLQGDDDDGPYELPVMVPLMQAINHATDHRSQIATMLSQGGIEPPELDVWAYDEAMRG